MATPNTQTPQLTELDYQDLREVLSSRLNAFEWYIGRLAESMQKIAGLNSKLHTDLLYLHIDSLKEFAREFDEAGQ